LDSFGIKSFHEDFSLPSIKAWCSENKGISIDQLI
jgi:hypothetical protein